MFAVLVTVVTSALLLGSPSASAKQPPASLEDQIAAADAQLKTAQAKLAKTFEAFTTAEQARQRADAAAKAAAAKATRARAEAGAAAKTEQDMRVRFDQFSDASFRGGRALNSVSMGAYLGSESPSDLLERVAMLDVIAAEYTGVLDATERAVAQKTAAERAAQTALDEAVRNRDAATAAKVNAERTYQAAVATQDAAKAEAGRLADRKADLLAQAKAAASTESQDSGAAPAPAPAPAPAGGGSSVTSAPGAVVRPAQGTLTSTYGARWGTVHYGIDIANSIGTPILSAMAGEVIDSGPASGFGLWVRVQHAGGLITVYGHINESLVSVGRQVAAGEQIATMGNRGQSTGPHLHFEVHQDGSKIDPLPWLSSHGVNL